jgi:hypothetical protein
VELLNWLILRDTTPAIGWRRVEALYGLRDWEAARQRLASLRSATPKDVDQLGMSGLIAAHLGNRSAALAVVDTLARGRTRYDFGLASQYRARIAWVLGDRDFAIAALRESLEQGGVVNEWIHRDPDLATLRSYEPFRRLLRERE